MNCVLYSKKKLLFIDEYNDVSILYRKGYLYARVKNFQEERIRLGSRICLASKYRILERVFRLEPRCIMPCEGGFLISCSGKVYRYLLGENKLHVELGFRKGMHNPLAFCDVRSLEGFPDCILFGEYWGNPEKADVRIWARINSEWTQVYSFPAGSVKHIHGIVVDRYRQELLILTGDTDEESGIWSMKNGFTNVEPLLIGKQKYRACVAFPSKDGIIYATDTPLENNGIYFAYMDGKQWKTKKIRELPGPCIYGCQLQDENGIPNYLLSTSVEPDSRLPSWKYMITYKLGPGVADRYSHLFCGNIEDGFKEIAKFRKDNFPMALFQFGSIQFPSGITNNIFLILQSTVEYEGNTIVLSK